MLIVKFWCVPMSSMKHLHLHETKEVLCAQWRAVEIPFQTSNRTAPLSLQANFCVSIVFPLLCLLSTDRTPVGEILLRDFSSIRILA